MKRPIPTAILLSLTIAASTAASAQSVGNTDDLPLEVQIELYMTELGQLLQRDDNAAIVELIPRIRALDTEIPDALFFLEARALSRTGQALAAQDRLVAYLTNTGREGKYYQQATELLLKVKQDAAEQERVAAEERAREAAKRRVQLEKAKILRTREAQGYLNALGFPLEETGELSIPTREAIAVFQVRRDLTVNGDINDEVLDQLKSEVPDSHSCDSLATFALPGKTWGIPLSQIPAAQAISTCNDALRDYPDLIRFQIQYARALVAAGRAEDAQHAVEYAARRGYPEAEILIGKMHARGMLSEKGKPDYVNAVRWYKMAADRDYPEAQRLMGHLYQQGNGVQRSDQVAVEFFHQAAAQGHAPAQVDLGLMFTLGRGIKRNYLTAIQWFTKAAEQGYPEGQFRLGEMLENGRGVKRDRATALTWYRQASDQGHTAAGDKVRRLGR